VTIYKSVSTILVSPNPKVVATINNIATSALGGILFNFLVFQYYNLSSKCVTEPYSKNYGRSYYWARYIGINNKSTI